jgi:hypothetical protein
MIRSISSLANSASAYMENDQEIATFTGEGPMETCAVSSNGQTIVVIETSGQAHFFRPVEPDKTQPAIGDTEIQILQQKEQATSATDS